MNTGQLVNPFPPPPPSKPTNKPTLLRSGLQPSPPSPLLRITSYFTYIITPYLSLPATSSSRSHVHTFAFFHLFRPSLLQRLIYLYFPAKTNTLTRCCVFHKSLVAFTAEFINFAWHLFASIRSLYCASSIHNYDRTKPEFTALGIVYSKIVTKFHQHCCDQV